VSQVFDHTSVLKLIEWRWDLAPLTSRDASADVGNLLDALDLSSYDPTVPTLPEPNIPAIVPCIPDLPELEISLGALELIRPFP
jgi:phospholipase C